MSWQILEGANQITVTLFEATGKLNAGVSYSQQIISSRGTELVDEWQELQAQVTIKLCLDWSDRHKEMIS